MPASRNIGNLSFSNRYIGETRLVLFFQLNNGHPFVWVRRDEAVKRKFEVFIQFVPLGTEPILLLAEETGIPELKTMARTIRDKLDGIVTYWTFRHISNAKMEGTRSGG